MAAPVVPMKLAKIVPINKMPVLSIGVPTSLPLSRMPPLIVKRAKRKIMNGKYSSSRTCKSSKIASSKPKKIVNGTKKVNAQKMLILPKWSCQKCGSVRGNTAMLSSMPTNGATYSKLRSLPSRCGPPPVSAARAVGAQRVRTVRIIPNMIFGLVSAWNINLSVNNEVLKQSA